MNIKTIIFVGSIFYSVIQGTEVIEDKGGNEDFSKIIWTADLAHRADLRNLWLKHLSDLHLKIREKDQEATKQMHDYKIQGFGGPTDYMDPHHQRYLAEVVGDPQAMEIVARAKLDGSYGFKKDISGAIYNLHRAAEMNHPVSLWYLAEMYRKGRYVEKDLTKALKLAEQMIDHSGRRTWGRMLKGTYLVDLGRDDEALAVFVKAGEEGEARGFLRAGKISRRTGKPSEQVIDYFERSIAKGNRESNLMLAQIYLGQLGDISVDPEKALYYVEAVVEHGTIRDQLRLAQFLGYQEDEPKGKQRREKLKNRNTIKSQRLFEKLLAQIRSSKN